MTTQHIETLIIGAGQAGLATGHHLKRRGREFVIVDGGERVGDNCRCHWDSLTLYSPAKYDGLPDVPGRPVVVPGKEVVANYLEQYTVEMDPPVRMQTRVERLEARVDGGFIAYLGTETIGCDNVVVATGSFGRTPQFPEFGDRLDPGIQQVHSTAYRQPSELAPGPTLVGASHTGCDIAYEVAADRPTFLVGPDQGQVPLDWNSPMIRVALSIIVFVWLHLLTRRNRLRSEPSWARSHGYGQRCRLPLLGIVGL